MTFSPSALDYKQKGLVAEASYLFAVGILSPFAVGLQNFSWFSHTLSYVLLCMLSLPTLVLFYRVYLPKTIGKRRFALFLVFLPLYFLVYELNDRIGELALLKLPFIPNSYKDAIRPAHPERLLSLHFNENFGYTVLVLLAATSLYVIKLLFRNQHNLATIENEKLKLELNQLKAQLQPHFFFNTINNMYSLSVKQSPKTPDMINDLSGVMRYILYDARQEQVLLAQEVDFIRSYIRLENIRHNEKDLISLLVQGDTGRIRIEPLIFLPLIENSFKHALRADMADKWVRLVLVAGDEELVFQTTNPKPPEAWTGERNGGGIGLANTRKRLNLLYPGRHELVIDNEANTFTVNLTISLKS